MSHPAHKSEMLKALPVPRRLANDYACCMTDDTNVIDLVAASACRGLHGRPVNNDGL